MEQIFKEFLTEISPALQNLLVTLVSLLVAQIIAYVQKQYGIAKTKLSADQQYLLDIIAERAVQTIEQVYRGEANQVKLDFAVDLVVRDLESVGLKIDLRMVKNAIEAQVFKKNAALPQG